MPSGVRGRPRSEGSRQRILAATRDLLLESGYDQLSIAAIADAAGVGRQTLYRWWPSKASIVAECVIENVLPLRTVVADPERPALECLRAWLGESRRRLAMPDQLALFRALTAAAASDETARLRLDALFGGAIRHSLRSALERGVESGELRADLPIETVADLLIGGMLYRLVRADEEAGDAVEDTLKLLAP